MNHCHPHIFFCLAKHSTVLQQAQNIVVQQDACLKIKKNG
jgi:hypothetical protein